MRKVVLPAALLALAAGLSTHGQDKAPRGEAEKKALARIQQLGGLALELAQNDPRLEVSYQQRGEKFTDECLVPLKDLKGLVHLNLRGQEVTDAGLAHLKGLTELTRLHLEKTKVTDKGLEHLKGLTNLEYLNLYGTEVSDAGLVHLEGLKKLRSLYVWQTKVTDAGVTRLQKALPQTEVVRGLDAEPATPPAPPAGKKDGAKKDGAKKKK